MESTNTPCDVTMVAEETQLLHYLLLFIKFFINKSCQKVRHSSQQMHDLHARHAYQVSMCA